VDGELNGRGMRRGRFVRVANMLIHGRSVVELGVVRTWGAFIYEGSGERLISKEKKSRQPNLRAWLRRDF
jgi:hypothetical protein